MVQCVCQEGRTARHGARNLGKKVVRGAQRHGEGVDRRGPSVCKSSLKLATSSVAHGQTAATGTKVLGTVGEAGSWRAPRRGSHGQNLRRPAQSSRTRRRGERQVLLLASDEITWRMRGAVAAAGYCLFGHGHLCPCLAPAPPSSPWISLERGRIFRPPVVRDPGPSCPSRSPLLPPSPPPNGVVTQNGGRHHILCLTRPPGSRYMRTPI